MWPFGAGASAASDSTASGVFKNMLETGGGNIVGIAAVPKDGTGGKEGSFAMGRSVGSSGLLDISPRLSPIGSLAAIGGGGTTTGPDDLIREAGVTTVNCGDPVIRPMLPPTVPGGHPAPANAAGILHRLCGGIPDDVNTALGGGGTTVGGKLGGGGC